MNNSTLSAPIEPSRKQKFISGLDQFLFAPVNSQVAAQFRIALGLMLAWNFVIRHPRGLSSDIKSHPDLANLYQQLFLTKPYYAIVAALLLLFIAGWRPRVIGAMLVLCLFPFCFMAGSQPGRQIMLFVLIAFSLVRSDACFSWRNGFNWNSAIGAAGPMWPIRLIQIQLSIVYGINALCKTTPHFLSGEALVNMSITLPNFRVSLADGYLHVGTLMVPVVLLAIATVVSEYTLAIGFWFKRFRVAVALFGVAFHMILKLIVRIFMLDWVSMFLYLAFLLPLDRPEKQK